MFTLAACKQSTIPEINFIDCCLSSSDQHFSYIYDKSISEFSPSKDYVKGNIQGTSQRSWSFHLCKCESECYNNDTRSLQLHFHYWFFKKYFSFECSTMQSILNFIQQGSGPLNTGSFVYIILNIPIQMILIAPPQI